MGWIAGSGHPAALPAATVQRSRAAAVYHAGQHLVAARRSQSNHPGINFSTEFFSFSFLPSPLPPPLRWNGWNDALPADIPTPSIEFKSNPRGEFRPVCLLLNLFVFIWAYSVTWIWTVDSGVCYDCVNCCLDFNGTHFPFFPKRLGYHCG